MLCNPTWPIVYQRRSFVHYVKPINTRTGAKTCEKICLEKIKNLNIQSEFFRTTSEPWTKPNLLNPLKQSEFSSNAATIANNQVSGMVPGGPFPRSRRFEPRNELCGQKAPHNPDRRLRRRRQRCSCASSVAGLPQGAHLLRLP